ncbi:MAG: DUF4249 domain-containing protein [Cyclobacteriaceae bacterium]
MKKLQNKFSAVKKVKHFPMIMVCFAMIGCSLKEEIPVPDFPPSLVVNCFFTTDSTLSIDLSRNDYFVGLQENLKAISDAKVVLYDGEVEVAIMEEDTTAGLYHSNFKPLSGHKYSLKVEKEGFETVYSRSVIPENNFSFSMGEPEPFQGEYQKEYKLTYMLHDTGIERVFYELQMYYYRDLYNRYRDWENDTTYWEYVGKRKSFVAFTEEGSELTGSHANQYFFTDELFDEGLKKETIRFSSYSFSSEGSDSPSSDTITVYMEVRRLTEELYNYKRSLKDQLNGSGQLFAEPVQVFNNIENGYGIFAGYNKEVFTFEIVKEED